MPVQLPRYNAQQKPPAVSGNVPVEKPEYLIAKEGFGKEIQQIGLTGEKIALEYEREKQHTQDLVELGQVQAAMTMDEYAIKDKYSNDPDYNSFPDKWKEDEKALADKYNGMVSGRNKARIQGEMARHLGTLSVSINGIKRKHEIAEIKDNIYKVGKSYVDIIGNIDDYDARQKEINKFDNFLNSMKGRELSEKDADKMRTTTLSHAEIKRVTRESLKDPMGTYDKLRTDPMGNYPYLEEEGLGKAKAIASAAVAEHKEKIKVANEINEINAVNIATGDSYTTPEGSKIRLTPEVKDQMLKTMMNQRMITNEKYLQLRQYFVPSGGKAVKPATGVKPKWGKMYKGSEFAIVNMADPEAVLDMFNQGYDKKAPVTKKNNVEEILKIIQGQQEGKPTNPQQDKPDPLGLRKK